MGKRKWKPKLRFRVEKKRKRTDSQIPQRRITTLNTTKIIQVHLMNDN